MVFHSIDRKHAIIMIYYHVLFLLLNINLSSLTKCYVTQENPLFKIKITVVFGCIFFWESLSETITISALLSFHPLISWMSDFIHKYYFQKLTLPGSALRSFVEIKTSNHALKWITKLLKWLRKAFKTSYLLFLLSIFLFIYTKRTMLK